MSRRPSNFLSSSQARSQARRLAGSPDTPFVSYDALIGIVDRECEKLGRRWYGVETADAAIQEIRASNPETRKAARQMLLERIDSFPLRAAS